MRVLYISQFLFGNACGAVSVSKTHLSVLKKAYGEANVCTFALLGIQEVAPSSQDGGFYLKRVEKSVAKRIINLLCGNSGKINNAIIEEICCFIAENRIDICFFDDSVFGHAIRKIRQRYRNLIIVSYYHDVKRLLCKEWMRKWPWKIPQCISLITNEYLTQKYADYNLLLNHREEEAYRKYYKKKADGFLPVALPDAAVESNIGSTYKGLSILFVGGYYYPNVNGIKWFTENVLDNLTFDCKLKIVGNGMDQLKNDFINNSNVEVYGFVECLSTYYDEADVVVGPIFEGAGMKVKTAEAFSYGKCFVGTDESLMGYIENTDEKSRERYIFCANTATEFVYAISKLQRMKALGQISKRNQEVIEIFRKNYSITSAAKYLQGLLI